MSGCNGCCGNCGSCGSSGGCMELTMGEIEMLQTLAQIPFLPVARKMGRIHLSIWRTRKNHRKNTA